MPDPAPSSGDPSWAARDAARSARLVGTARFGAGAALAQGTVLRSTATGAAVGAGSLVLENSVAIAAGGLTVGRRTVFGHRCVLIDATIGDLCEIGNGSIILAGARLGDRCFLGEGTLIPPGATFDDDSVVVGRPGRVVRRASEADLARLTALRGGSLDLPAPELQQVSARPPAGASMGALYEYRGIVPTIDPTAIVFDTAELTGDVVVDARSIIGAGVRIIGDSHGPVRIGARVQILENTVLHLLPDNELVIEDDVVIGPSCMIHGCHIGAASIIEPAAIVCDGAVVGAGAWIGAGSLVKQRQRVDERTRAEGFPATAVDRLDAAPALPAWALRVDELDTLIRRR
jgi:carbonic anhydrase/acetyltransferase-like protein (isoleucine patch superfamily)